MKINFGRVLLGGLLAGVVSTVFNVVWWKYYLSIVKSVDLTPVSITATWIWVDWILAGLLCGMLTVWLYAAIRPRYGAGPRTAVRVGIAVWLFSNRVAVVENGIMLVLFPRGMLSSIPWRGLVWEFAGAILAAVVGAWVYRE